MLLAGHGETEGRRIGRTAARHLDRQRSAVDKPRLHKKVVGRGSCLLRPAAISLHLDLAVLGRHQRGGLGKLAEHRDGGVERMGSLDSRQRDAVLGLLAKGHLRLHLRPERHRGGKNSGAQHAADRTGDDELACLLDGSVAAHLEPDRGVHARGSRGFGQRFGFGAVAPERIFAIDVLSRSDRPADQIAMGRDVYRHRDHVDVGIGEDLPGIAVGCSRPKGLRGLLGGGLIPGRDGAEFKPLEFLHGRHVRDLRPPPLGAGADDPDLQCSVHGLLPF